jgi:hypothetical protein
VLVEDKVDAGSVIDTAPCFEHGGTLFWDGLHPWSNPTDAAEGNVAAHAQSCASRLGAPAVGLLRAHRDGGMETLVHVQSHRLAITPHQGEPRMLGITLWRALLHSPFAQAVAALVVLLAQGATAWEAVTKFGRWLHPTWKAERRRWRATERRAQSTRSRLP